MNARSLFTLLLLTSFSLFGCGGDSGGDAQGSATEDSGAAEPAADAQMEEGSRTDLDDFLEEYEEFVDQYCELTDQFATASVTDLQALAEKMSAQGMELSQYSTRAVALKASASQEAQDRLEAMQEKAEACANKISG